MNTKESRVEFRVQRAIKAKAQARAQREGSTLSALLSAFVAAYAKEENQTLTLSQIETLQVMENVLRELLLVVSRNPEPKPETDRWGAVLVPLLKKVLAEKQRCEQSTGGFS
jgi:hypothetical protein